ncbi:unnamed protein product [Urochloa humidicola]
MEHVVVILRCLKGQLLNILSDPSKTDYDIMVFVDNNIVSLGASKSDIVNHDLLHAEVDFIQNCILQTTYHPQRKSEA